jgi:D-serine deaminase-like pyridoxal phosphate-dependent protein
MIFASTKKKEEQHTMSQPQPGDHLNTLDTPAMIVDLDLMEANVATLMERLRHSNVHIRPHLKTVKSPILAYKLLAAGAIGGCVSKVSEAEVMALAGIEDLLITTEIVGVPKVQRLVQLVQQHPQIKVVVDSLIGAQALNQAMQNIPHPLLVLIELNVGQNRCGVEPGDATLALAQQITKLEHLHLIGVQGYEGHLQHVHDPLAREQQCRTSMRLLTETATALREAGFPIEIVTTGGTGTTDICAHYPGVTEVQPGSFIFMDIDYRNAIGPVYANALSILSTVISRPTQQRAVVDAGLKSLSTDSGMAEPKNLPSWRYRPGGDEHGILTWNDSSEMALSNQSLKIGNRIELLPSHIDTTVNLHDMYYAHRNGILEELWSVTARGKVQ